MAGKSWGLLALVGGGTLLLCCGAPLYWFYFHCPPPYELLEVKRKIRVGMTVEEAERLMPSSYRHETDVNTGEALSQENGFSGYLLGVDSCSVQCVAYLIVECRDGTVTKVRLELYNDLDHSSQEIE